MTTEPPEGKVLAFPAHKTAAGRSRQIAAECLMQMMLVLVAHEVISSDPEKQTDDRLIIETCRKWVSVLQLAIGTRLGLDPVEQGDELLTTENCPPEFKP